MAGNMFEDPEMQEIFEGFLVESQELLDAINQDLMTIEEDPENQELLNQIFRSFHTIKGTSSFMGFNQIVDITHHAEDILNKLRRDEMSVNQDIIDVLLDVHDWIEKLMEHIQNQSDEEMDYSDTVDQLIQLKEGKTLVTEEDAETVITDEEKKDSGAEKSPEEEKSAVDQVLSNSEMIAQPGDFSDEEEALLQAAFAEVNKDFSKSDTIDNALKNLESSKAEQPEAEKKETPEAQKNEEKKSEKTPATQTKSKKQTTQAKSKVTTETIRIDINRVETLMDLSGELVLGRNRLAQISEQLQNEYETNDHVRALEETTDSIDTITSDIQSAVMRMRMVPVGKLYQKAPRIVRDLSREFKKKIKLVVKGEETEIDRGIIEELNDPLVHMIRNSCDHGIEPPEEREKLGKPAEGTITLDAEQEGNNIVLTISDDGRGMDPEKLKAKALEKGLISNEQAMQMPEREVFQLIFAPGFSTAAKVSNVSGRGVGMDVVRTNIQELKGMVDINSELGIGSTFIVKLPLTLAIIQGLLVKVQKETYAIPLSAVVEVVAIDIKSVYSVNQQEVIRLRDEVYPIIRLDKALKIGETIEKLDNRNVVVVGFGMQRVGLVVDDLLGQQEIVIKSLGEYLGKLTGIAGSTILGDGRVIMIIDVGELINTTLSAGGIGSGIYSA